MIENIESISENFMRARKFVEKSILGFNLTNIELKELMNHVKHTTKIYIQDTRKSLEKSHLFSPDYEAALIFLNKNYGTQIYGIEDKAEFNVKREIGKKELGFDYYSEGFKKMQDEMHNRIGY